MSRFDDMINGLRDEMDIPETVWRGTDTFGATGEKRQKKFQRRQKNGIRK